MEIKKNVSLAEYSTMGLGGNAEYLTVIDNRNDLVKALDWAEQNKQPVIMIGGGSNIIWGDQGFKGLIIVNEIHKYEIFKEDSENTYITVGAGENWDKVVERTANAGLSGIEALSLVPGSSGATPVQNIGAYGQEISQTLTALEVYDSKTKQFMMLTNADCAFGYRTSRFKTTDKGRFYINALTLHLRSEHMKPPFYESLGRYLDENNIKDYSPASIRKAVIAIRSAKLPDPAKVKNCGSFFTNPIIPKDKYLELKKTFTNMPHWLVGTEKVKIPAAWLIENAGFKDYKDSETGMATWVNQPLVLVNEHAKSTSDLLKFKAKIETAVLEKFGIKLEQEPELVIIQ